MFISQACQHTINDLEDKPDSLKWKLTDGNFKAVEGEWKLRSIDDGQHTEVRYTMEVDPGPPYPQADYQRCTQDGAARSSQQRQSDGRARVCSGQ